MVTLFVSGTVDEDIIHMAMHEVILFVFFNWPRDSTAFPTSPNIITIVIINNNNIINRKTTMLIVFLLIIILLLLLLLLILIILILLLFEGRLEAYLSLY